MRLRRRAPACIALALLLLACCACATNTSAASPGASPMPTATTEPTRAASPTATATATATVTRPGPPGIISGDQLGYPGDSMPALAIYAISTADSHTYFHITTQPGQFSYAITGVASGSYYVVAYLASARSPAFKASAGAYTAYVVCGMNPECDNHALVPVTVTTSQGASGVNPNDYYGATIPPQPGS